MKTKWVDFNTLLTGMNLAVMGATVLAFGPNEGNEYIDGQSIALAVLLCLQTQMALLLERRWRDPFMLLLAFSMIFYYSVRILTLTLYPFSEVFGRYPYSSDDSNYALTFIIVANVFLYAGFFLTRFKGDQKVHADDWRATSPARVVALMSAAIVFTFFSGSFWTEDNIPRGLNFLVIFLQPNITVLMALSYYFLFRKSLGPKFAVAIATLIALEMTVHTLIGSRSALVSFIQNCIFVGLAVSGCIKFSRKYAVLGVAMLPVLIGLLVASFTISTFNRANKESGGTIELGRAVELAGQSSEQLSLGASLDVMLPPIFSRAGFFDYSAEIIAHRDQYAEVFDLSTYAKSIVDNILTPGFDLFDQPKIANALQFIYRDMGTPSKIAVDESYQSDQLGIYGEFYGLFGYASLPLLFLLAFFIKRFYVHLKSTNPFQLVIKRAVVLFVFSRIIDSFGIDWTIIEILPLMAAIFVYRFFFECRRRSSSRAELPPHALLGPI